LTALRIQFRLRNPAIIPGWKSANGVSLSWFGLSDGLYVIETPAGRLYEQSGPADPDLGRPWCDYQVSRLFEDLITAWPSIADPVPDDVMTRFLAKDPYASPLIKAELAKDDPDWDLLGRWEAAYWWWHERLIDGHHLPSAPDLHLWRTGSEGHLSWTASAPWTVAAADLTLPFAELEEAVAQFFGDFVGAMGALVRAIARDGWHRRDCRLDIEQLVAQQEERENWGANALARQRPRDWDQVRAALTALGS
jgi:Family of unknown function (DUF5984)